MNRTIKFRVWDGAGSAMLDTSGWTVNMLNQNERPIMQFTGLLDKNGKEIYEGDIVGTVLGQFVYRREVFQEECGAWCIKLPSGSSTGESSVMLIAGKYTVIGNVWENKDLIL